MDLGAVGLDGLVGSDTTTSTGFGSSLAAASDHETKHKWHGSGFLMKQERSGNNSTEDDDDYWRNTKVAKTTTDDKAVQRNSLLRSNATLFSDGQHHHQQMLSFSSPKSETMLVEKSSTNATLFPYTYLPLSSSNRNPGYNSSGSMHGFLAGTRGSFTPSQWMELEHQALIYKYITANVAVPSHLLNPIKKALDSAGFCNFSTGLLRPNAMGWDGFHLGFSNNTDPEPGRCRRTDGKKWRCSRDAVVDQKYCERHMNRGRHRSRKPVEGQSGHALTGTTTTTTTNTTNNATTTTIANATTTTTTGSKIVIPNGNASVVVPGSTASNSLNFAQQKEPKNMHPLASDTPVPNNINRMFMINKDNGSERIQDADALPMLLPPTLELKPKENPFMIHKQQIPYAESSRNEFGLVTSDSLLNPSHKSSNRETDSQHSLRHFIDDWPKTQPNRPGSSWPELDMQSERTELSISIPMTTTSTDDKVTLSPLRLSRELDPIQMGLGVGNALNDSNSRQANWIPIIWESSMGGPLGEVLNLSNNNSASDHHCGKNSSALNLMTDGWDNSPPLGSSPTGVLQKAAFGSLSNSSAGSSPRAENKTQEGASLCNDLLSSTLGNSSSFPSL